MRMVFPVPLLTKIPSPPLLKMMFLNILILRGPPMVLLDAPCICTPSPAFPKSCVPEVSVPL